MNSEISFLDYDTENKEELDAIAVRSLNERGAVWYKKNGQLYYMSKEWVANILKQKNSESQE